MKAISQIRWLMLVLVFFCCSGAASAQDIVLIVNKDVQISEIRTADLRAIFTGGKTRFADGAHAVPVILKGGPVHEVFLKHHLGEGPEEFRAQWRKTVFTGQGAMPRTFDSESSLIQYVAVTPGAIGYASRISFQDDVKTLAPVK